MLIRIEKSADCLLSRRTFDVDKTKPILNILTITFDLPSIFSFISLISKLRHDKEAFVIPPTITENGAQDHIQRHLRDNAKAYAKFDARDCRAQKQGTMFDPKQHLIRRALSESDLSRRTIQLLNDDSDVRDDVPNETPAERAVWFRACYFDSLRYSIGRLQIFYDEIVNLQDQLKQSRAEHIELQTQCDSLRQKYYSAGRFTAKYSIWLFVRTRRLLEDANETVSGPSLTEFQVSCPERKKLLTCRPAHDIQESTASDPFEVDHYFGPSSNNRDVYRKVEHLIDIVFHGYDVCIFADGQSGSGKSWTMFKGNNAIAPSIAASVMTWKDVGATQGWTRQIKYSAIEIYQDRLKDLLVAKGGAKVDILKAKNGDCDRSVETVEELLGLFQRAYRNLEVRKTHENRESSRGHFFCSLVLAQSHPDEPPVRSRITLIDLAGGKRIQTRAKNKLSQTTMIKGGSSNAAADEADSFLTSETKFINSSRGALRTFLQQTKKLKQGSAVCEVGAYPPAYVYQRLYIQFTRYLKLVLENNPRLIYLAHLDPRSTQYGRTLDTVKFAKEVSKKSGSSPCGRHPLTESYSCAFSLFPKTSADITHQYQKAPHLRFEQQDKDPKSPSCGI